MSDEDQVRVREIRLCQCGKPAGHSSICHRNRDGSDGDDQAERIDRAAEDRMAVERSDRHAKRRQRFDAERRLKRSRMSTIALLTDAMQRAARLSTVSGANPEATRSGTDTPNGPPRQQQITDDPRWDDATRIVRKRVLQLLDLIDEAEGTGHAAVIAAMDGTDKDRIIVQEGRGLIAEQVVAELGPEYGSASYIRKLRRTLNLDNRGYPKETA